MFIYPLIVATASAVNANNYKLDSVSGEVSHSSMEKHLADSNIQRDNRYKYNAGGIIRLFDMCKLEVMLSKTYGLGNNKNVSIILLIIKEFPVFFLC